MKAGETNLKRLVSHPLIKMIGFEEEQAASDEPVTLAPVYAQACHTHQHLSDLSALKLSESYHAGYKYLFRQSNQ